MNRNMEQWLSTLNEMCDGTDYNAIRNGGENSTPGIAIVRKGTTTPQRICVYPKKKVGPGMAIEMDVYQKIASRGILMNYARVHGNRPHYNDLTDEDVMTACRIFLEQ